MDDNIGDIDNTTMTAAGPSVLQHLNVVIAGTEAPIDSKLDSFVAAWRHRPLAILLVAGEKVYIKRRRTSRARPDYGHSACGKMRGDCFPQDPTSYKPSSPENVFVCITSSYLISIAKVSRD